MSNQSIETIIDLDKPIAKYDKLAISINYSLGGYNYFSSQQNSRGYRITFKPCCITNGFSSSTLMGDQYESGFYIFLAPTTRFNKKQLVEDKIK